MSIHRICLVLRHPECRFIAYADDIHVQGTAEHVALAVVLDDALGIELGDQQAVAGDLALLLIDRWRRKYGKGTPLERRPGGLADTLSFKAGQIDPRTGQRAASASIELTDQIHLLGNVDVHGDYRGLLRYVLRFK